jgi:hypothetical protein
LVIDPDVPPARIVVVVGLRERVLLIPRILRVGQYPVDHAAIVAGER